MEHLGIKTLEVMMALVVMSSAFPAAFREVSSTRKEVVHRLE